MVAAPVLNPFPDSPVTRIADSIGDVQRNTVVTESIARSRTLIDEYLTSRSVLSDESKAEALIVGIKGDYGSGKTHLLLDAAAQLHNRLQPDPFSYVVRVACTEVEPLKWYRTVLGKELVGPTLQELVGRMYARAGEIVAAEAALTVPAVGALNSDWTVIRKLVRDHLLDVTAIDKQFAVLLQNTVPGVSDDIRAALSGLLWVETRDGANRWIAGEELNPLEQSGLRVSKPGVDENDATALIVATAALSLFAKRWFALLIDELEQFMRFDASRDANRDSKVSRLSMTWLKRLLEGLAPQKAVVFVAGHWDAWRDQTDYLDRFTQQTRPIEVVRFQPKDVTDLVHARVQWVTPQVFSDTEATLVTDLAEGNARRVQALCYAVFRASDGMTRRLERDEIVRLAEQTGQRTSVEEARTVIKDAMRDAGLTVVSSGSIDERLTFDLLGLHGDQPAIAIDFKRLPIGELTTDAPQVREVRRFYERITEARATYPALLGIFVVDGALDPGLLQFSGLTSEAGVLWFGLAQRDVLREIRSSMTSRLATSGSATASGSQSNGATLRNEIAQLDAMRSAEQTVLYSQVAERQAAATTPRDSVVLAPAAQVQPDAVSFNYDDLIRPPGPGEEIQLLSAGPDATSLLLSIVAIILSVVLIFSSDAICLQLFPGDVYGDVSPAGAIVAGALRVLAVLAIVASIWRLWQAHSQLNLFFDYNARLLREMYLRKAEPYELTRAAHILRTTLEALGPRRARFEANDALRSEFPQYLQ